MAKCLTCMNNVLQVQETCQYDLLVPLALMFYSSALQVSTKDMHHSIDLHSATILYRTQNVGVIYKVMEFFIALGFSLFFLKLSPIFD